VVVRRICNSFYFADGAICHGPVRAMKHLKNISEARQLRKKEGNFVKARGIWRKISVQGAAFARAVVALFPK
jgi:hypothetical protein